MWVSVVLWCSLRCSLPCCLHRESHNMWDLAILKRDRCASPYFFSATFEMCIVITPVSPEARVVRMVLADGGMQTAVFTGWCNVTTAGMRSYLMINDSKSATAPKARPVGPDDAWHLTLQHYRCDDPFFKYTPLHHESTILESLCLHFRPLIRGNQNGEDVLSPPF
jgi:hypothetical protein